MTKQREMKSLLKLGFKVTLRGSCVKEKVKPQTDTWYSDFTVQSGQEFTLAIP